MNKSIIIIGIIIASGLTGSLLFMQNKLTVPGYNSLSKTSVSYDPIDYSPAELSALLKKNYDNHVVIDVRSKLEYDKGHVPGAVHADYFDLESLKKAAGIKSPVTYDSFNSMRGPYAAYELYKVGYKNVAVLSGGLSAWAEDIETLESKDPQIKTVFNHPKNIFPVREKNNYPPRQGQVEFSITAKKFEFVPNKIKVKHGQKVILHIKSIDVIHGFALPEFGIEEELLPNEQKDITFIAARKGTFTFICNVICGHKHSSMVGNIIVN